MLFTTPEQKVVATHFVCAEPFASFRRHEKKREERHEKEYKFKAVGLKTAFKYKGRHTGLLLRLMTHCTILGRADPAPTVALYITRFQSPSATSLQALRHSFGELKLISSKFNCTQHSANKFASVFVCTNFLVVAKLVPMSVMQVYLQVTKRVQPSYAKAVHCYGIAMPSPLLLGSSERKFGASFFVMP